jgi:predicted O-methyltransferase YrrM
MLDAQVLHAIDELEAFQADRHDAWNVPREEGYLLHGLALAAGARRIVEVGTSYGFSGLFLASAARAGGGRLETFDTDPAKHERARRTFEDAGLSEVVRLHTGDALELLADIAAGVDFAFLDATKSETLRYWHVLEPKLGPQCVVTLDNTRTHPAPLADFVEMLRQRGDFAYTDLPIGHGLGLAVRRRA